MAHEPHRSGRIGRNDPCPCRSGRKWKRCHGGAERGAPTSDVYTRNLALLQILADVFGLRPGVPWDDVKRRVTADRVRTLHNAHRMLWAPPITDALPARSSALTALYLGDIEPDDLARRIFRFGLYADRILVINPFIVPSTDDSDPVHTPEKYRRDTIRLLYFAYRTRPWIESGLVTLIGDPMIYDPVFRAHSFAAAERRHEGLGVDPRDLDLVDAKAEFRRVLSSMPPSSLEALVRERHPEFSDAEVEDLVRDLIESNARDPLGVAYDDDGPNAAPTSEFMFTRGGTTLEGALAIGEATGAFPYTYSHTKWRELMASTESMPEQAQIWSPLTRAFQALEFRFLNEVDADFAKRVREDGRLIGFRHFLKDLWTKIGGSPDDVQAEALAREFAERLSEEHRRANEEWKKIDRDLFLVKPALLGALGQGAALLTGNMSVATAVISAVVATTAGLTMLKRASERRNEWRVATPMSVFVDLQRERDKARR